MQQKTSRRRFLEMSATLPLGLLTTHPAWAATLSHLGNHDFPIPDFSSANVQRYIAGLRPLRTSGIRIERENLGTKILIHNYGHGGAGVTLSWGSAEAAVDLIRGLAATEVAVIGAGVVGLSTAWILREQGFKVTVYYREISPDTTSDIAGAQFSPSFVSPGHSPQEVSRYNQIVARSYQRFAALQHSKYGVTLRPNYLPTGFTDDLEKIQAGVLKPFSKLARFPFQGKAHGGKVIQSFLIEPPIYLPAVIQDLVQNGVTFQRAELTDFQSVAQNVIFNCTGLGSVKLVGDKDLIPMRGQLVLLKPLAGQNYILLHKGYIFPRRDAIVVGGTFERGVWDPHPNAQAGAHILQINRDYFGV